MANLSYQFWFRSREDYEAIRGLVTDEPRLCDSFEQWQQTANEFIEKQRANGLVVKEVFIDPNKFTAFCETRAFYDKVDHVQ
jgi:hypothetical protein